MTAPSLRKKNSTKSIRTSPVTSDVTVLSPARAVEANDPFVKKATAPRRALSNWA